MSISMNNISYIERRRHGFFLGSLLFLLIGNVFFSQSAQRLATLLLLTQNVLFGLFIIKRKSRFIKLLFYVFLSLAIAYLLGVVFGNVHQIDRAGQILFIIYFMAISTVAFHDLYHEKNFSMETVYAVFSGFILLSFAFGFILLFLNNIIPNSLQGIENEALISEYHYFSFITLMTIGYGDITPHTEVAKKIVVFASLLGHFYTVFITAIIIGKLSMKQSHGS